MKAIQIILNIMFHQIYLQNCLLLLLAVYLFKAVVAKLRFLTNYYNKYHKLGEIV